MLNHLIWIGPALAGPGGPADPHLDLDLGRGAQEQEEEEEAPQEEGWSYRAFAFGRAYGGADFDDAGGDLDVHRFGVAFTASRPLGGDYRLTLGTRVERSEYDFGGSSFTGGVSDPFDDLYRPSVWASLSGVYSEEVSWTGSLFTSAGVESGAGFSDAFTYGLGGTVRYEFSDTFALSLGLFGTTRLEDDFLVYPVSAIDWQISEDLHLGSEGSGVGLGLELSEKVRTYFNVAFEVRQFRLDGDDFAVPTGSGPVQFADGVFRDDELSANLGVLWTPSDELAVELTAGVALRETTLLTDGGDGIQDDVDPAPYLGLSISYGF